MIVKTASCIKTSWLQVIIAILEAVKPAVNIKMKCIKLHGCAGLSMPLLFLYLIIDIQMVLKQVFSWGASFNKAMIFKVEFG